MRTSLSSVLLGLVAFCGLVACTTNQWQKGALDLGLAGTGAAIGHHASDGEFLPTAGGAVVGYVTSQVVQREHQRALDQAEKAGYARAMNQAVKQQYWVIQNQQKFLPADDESAPRLVPTVIPEMNINGVIINEHLEYLRIDR